MTITAGPAQELRRAWLAVAAIPVGFILAFAVGEGLYSAFGYDAANADAPWWVVLISAVPSLAVFLLPCVGAVVFGRRAQRAGERGGLVPLVIGALLGGGFLLLSVLSTANDLLS